MICAAKERCTTTTNNDSNKKKYECELQMKAARARIYDIYMKGENNIRGVSWR